MSKLIGAVLVPQTLEVFDIGHDYILGSSRDAFDRDEIRLYTLSRTRTR